MLFSTVPAPAAPNITNAKTVTAMIFFTAISFLFRFRRVTVSFERDFARNSKFRFVFGSQNRNAVIHRI
jgi:hypothetical protein